MADDIIEPYKKKLKTEHKDLDSPSKFVSNGNNVETGNVLENNLDIITPKKKHKKKKKRPSKTAEEIIDVITSNCDSNLETESISINETLLQNTADNIEPKKKHKKKKEKLIETIQESSNVIEYDFNSNVDDTNLSLVKKKKKRKNTDQESDLNEKEEKIETSFDNSETNNKEVKSPSNMNQKLIQKPSYRDNKLTDFSDYREWKRSIYPDLKEDVLLRNEGRNYTISIALPASILEETCLAHVLRTYVIGQLARASCIYSIDEIIVFNDKCWGDDSANCDKYMGMMKMILEYQECPQYLRKDLFPKHYFMKDAGVLNALNAPHHLLAYQWCDYREGVVLSKCSGKYSFVDIGLKSDVQVDRKLEPGLRVTVRLPPETKTMKKLYGYVVSPEEPRLKTGMYWGYTVRVAQSLSEVFKSDRFSDGYDLVIGTSDKGTSSDEVTFKKFSHALIVFGGVRGLEAAQQADESLSKSHLDSIFHHYVNVCPNQTSRTIRTEEAVLITLSTLCPKLTIKGCTKLR